MLNVDVMINSFNSGGQKIFNMENLDKDFLDEMQVKYPFAIDVFKKWVTEYTQKRAWKALFHSDTNFEDLPIEFQQGIMNRFFIETYAGKAEYIYNCESRYKKDMSDSIEQLQSRLRPTTGMN